METGQEHKETTVCLKTSSIQPKQIANEPNKRGHRDECSAGLGRMCLPGGVVGAGGHDLWETRRPGDPSGLRAGIVANSGAVPSTGSVPIAHPTAAPKGARRGQGGCHPQCCTPRRASLAPSWLLQSAEHSQASGLKPGQCLPCPGWLQHARGSLGTPTGPGHPSCIPWHQCRHHVGWRGSGSGPALQTCHRCSELVPVSG